MQGFFRSGDGTAIYYESSGEGRPLIFCYGLVCSIDHLHFQIEHFSQRYQVIAFDYRGHHRSSTPQNDRNITLEWCAKDVQGLIRHLGLKEAVCIGHSMGVPISVLLSALEPQVLKGLVLICGSVGNPFKRMFYSDKLNAFYEVVSRLYDAAPEVAMKVWKKLTDQNRLSYFIASKFGFNPTLAEERTIRMYLEGVNQTPVSTFQALLRDYTKFEGARLLPGIQCPALVIAGDKDCITPIDIQEDMCHRIPNAVFSVIPDGSHNALTDLPEVVNGRIDRFLETIQYV
ncbi:MAG: alpha/beta hydrolase [Deltaproteobacteria bacterium]|nr:alpha/beta hydrolase [Deltaproteobacteria bacterium]